MSIFRTILLLGLVVVYAEARGAYGVTLAWNAEQAPVAGYRVYQGGATQTYTNVVDVGAQARWTVSNLVGSATYYFAVTAYDGAGLESAFSRELVWTARPEAPVLTLSNVLVAAPVVFWGSTNLRDWSVAGSGVAWMVGPKTNTAGFFRAQFLPLTVGVAP